MKPQWNRSESIIVDLLRDYAFHCPTIELQGQIKDDRARLSSIRRKLRTVGYDIESKRCNLHRHSSNVLMRRIVKLIYVNPAQKPVENRSNMWRTYNTQVLKFFDEYEKVSK